MDINDLRQSIIDLSPEKRALLERRLTEMGLLASGEGAIPRRDRSAPCPLSLAQQRLWFLDQLEHDNSLYNISRAVRLQGALQVGALREALNALVARHEPLRSTFVLQGEEPVQVVAEQGIVALPVLDLSAVPDGTREAALERILRTEARRPFDLTTDLILRALVVRLGARDHVFLLTVHHIASDGWSMRILARELAACYAAVVQGRPLNLPPLPIQYGDYAVWQRGWLQGDALGTQLSYWKAQLAGAPPTLALPTDRPRPAAQTYCGAHETAVLGRDLADALHALSRRAQVTLFMTLLGGFATLLHRYAGIEDLVLGTATAGRRHVETEALVGFFVNTLAMRVDLAGDPSFRTLLLRVREMVLAAYDHQDLPFEKLVAEVRPERSLSWTPLVQVMFTDQAPDRATLDLPGLTASAVEVDTGTARFDLTASVKEGPQGLSVTLEYNTDMYDAATIKRMLGHYETLLGSIVADPGQRLSALPLLTAAERHQLLVDWNATQAPLPPACIHELFEAQVERSPDAVAVTSENESLTYRELNRRANQRAHHLRERGVRPDTVVGVCLAPSVDLIAVLLGILKAGGAYLPLDPVYPTERLAFMLEDAQAVALVTRQEHVERLPATGIPIIALDAAPQGDESTANPAHETTGEHLAYLMYTSGSTGRPKAVAVPHRCVVRLVLNTDYVSISPSDVIAQISNVSFDAATFEIWGALLSGARLVVIPREIVLSPAEFSAAIEQHGITMLFLTSALLGQMAREAPSAFRQLRTLLVGGETVEPWSVQAVLKHGAPERLLNAYGPTETTTFASWYLVEDVPEGTINIPIGRPISNTQLYLLDRHLNPVAIGVPGELHIGGPGVARGYHLRPELTVEKFIPDPFCARPGARLYKTGDLARYLPDGNIEFLGRMDQQVKIRGHRIEPGEIEAVLRQHPAVREVLVLVREDVPGDKRLVAYLVSDQAPAPGADELRGFLQAKLADYMVPAAFVRLDALPLTPNGKVDRRSLPAPESSGADTDYVAPRDAMELQLAQLWEDLLEVHPVGVTADFFELGGHSLLAGRLLARVRERFHAGVSLRAFFGAPTVAGLAAAIVQQMAGGPEGAPAASDTRIPRQSEAGPCALSFAQQRLWVLEQLEPDGCVYNIPTAVRLRGALDVGALREALATIVARHEALRTTFAVRGAAPVQVVAERWAVELPVVDLSAVAEGEREAEVERVLRTEARRPFDLGADLMLRGLLVRLGEWEHVLLLTLHHIASDGWSMGILARELTALYGAIAQGREPALAPLPIQYGDYAVWQRGWLQGAELEQQLGYWKGQLAGVPAMLQLPTDRPRPAVQSYRGGREAVVLSRGLTDGLHALSRREHATLFMTLVGAFTVLLHRYIGEDDVVVGTPIAGRRRVETEPLIGFFVNTLVLRADLSGDPTFREFLGRVRERVLGAYDHQDLPFERLVEDLRPERSLSWNPLVQVMFALQDAEPRLELPGLTVSPVEVDTGISKFDLTAGVREGPQGLRVTLGYNTDLYDAATIKRMLGHYETLLGGIVADPEERLSTLPLLTAVERHQLLVEWNAPRTTLPAPVCVHELFEAQVERTPEAVAVTFEDQSLTYRELNQRANQLAHYLRRRGAEPDVLVGLCLERSLDMIVGLLGILKAGAAYVPFDPADPPERLAFMLEDARVSVLVTQQRFLQRLPESMAPAVCLDTDAAVIAREEQNNPVPRAAVDDLCYVMYTSGSTGKPKGVMITHRGVSNLMACRRAIFPMNGSDVMLQQTPVTFDFSVDEIFSPLLVGARLVVARPEGHRDCRYLIDTIRAARVTRLGLVPSLMQALLEEPDLDTCTSLRWVSAGGEAVRRTLLERFRARLNVELVNIYGPTETTVEAAYWVAEQQVTTDVVPIGRPMANAQLYVLDTHLQPVPIGVPGELYIGGAGLARGYLGRPELTAERFVPNPFSVEVGARLYKTGDLVRYLPDGNVEYLGRLDHQVKLRGVRIELGEIEATLREHPEVRDAAVVAREDPPGDKRLVAYVVSLAGTAPTREALRRFLQAKLPASMVPSAFVLLPALPLTSSGKVDRRNLPAPDPTRPDGDYVAPRDMLERQLAQLWEDLLGVHPVGAADNFFELGGHSLLAGRLLARVRERFHVDVSLRTFFTAPTVADLATAIVQKLAEGADAASMTRMLDELWNLSDEDAGRLLGDMGT